MKKFILLLALILILGSANSVQFDYVNDFVSVDNQYGNISFYPIITKSPVRHFIGNFSVNSKEYAGSLCIAYYFEEPLEEAYISRMAFKNVTKEITRVNPIEYSSTCWNNVTEEWYSCTKVNISSFVEEITTVEKVFTSLTHVFDKYEYQGLTFYAHENPAHFNPYETKYYTLDYRTSTDEGKFGIMIWNSKSGNCVNDYRDKNYDFVWDNDPFYNVTYPKRFPINCTNMSLGARLPIVVNGSTGFCNSQQIVWTYCTTGNPSVYYDTLCGAGADYIIANDSQRLPNDIEVGSSTSGEYLNTTVWINHTVVYHFTEINVTDYSPNSYHGDGTGGDPDRKTSGCAIGYCVEYDGTGDYTKINNIPDWTSAGIDRTLETYVYNDVDYNEWDVVWTFRKHRYYLLSSDHSQYYGGSQDTLDWGWYDGGNWETVDIEPGNITSSVWYHVFVDINLSGNYEIFLDGNRTDTNNYEAPSGVSEASVIGARETMAAGFWDGKFDEFRIWKKMLNTSEKNQVHKNYLGIGGYGDLLAGEQATTTTTTSSTTSSTSTTSSSTTTTLNLSGVMKYVLEDRTLSEHYVCFYQRVNYTNEHGNESWRENMLHCVNAFHSYEYYMVTDDELTYEELSLPEGVIIIARVQEREEDMLSNPEEFKERFERYTGYIILGGIVLAIGVMLYYFVWKRSR